MTKRGILVATTVVLAVLLTGCFWTPDDAGEGGITLEIDASELGGSGVSGSGVSGSQTEEFPFDGFFTGYVISDDLMRGDEAAAEAALNEVDVALDAAIEEAFTNIAQTGDIGNFNIEVAFPSIQLQANLFSGTSGSNTFRGLRAGSEYLVVVFAESIYDFSGGIGYAVTSIEGGKTKSVGIDVGDNWDEFDQFLANRYGIVYESYDEEPATVVVSFFSQSESTFYLDLVGDIGAPSSGDVWDDWYTAGTPLDTDGDPIGKSGNRPTIPSGSFSYTVTGVAPGKTWRIMLTTWSERLNAQTGNFYLSKPVETTPGETTIVTMYYGTDFGYYSVYTSSPSSDYLIWAGGIPT